VVIDEFGTVIHDIYLRTSGRPIEAVQQGLAEVERVWGSRLQIQGVGTTGSLKLPHAGVERETAHSDS